jgi:hypothetical protein
MSIVNSSLPLLTGGRQTMLSWSRVIESYEAVPDVFKDSCKTMLEHCHPFPFVVLAPVTTGTRHKATEKLLCVVNDVFYIWEREGSQIAPTTFPVKTIGAIEVGRILLYSWLTIIGVTGEGVATSFVIPFNTATGRHLEPFINKMRPASTDIDEICWGAEKAKFDYLGSVDFKFMNYARKSLLRGETVVHIVWQPQIRERIFTLFGWEFHRTLALKHFVILTDKEVIVIGDDKHISDHRGFRYGGIWQFIPLSHIVEVGLIDQANGMVILSLALAHGDQRMEWVFEASNKPALKDLQEELIHIIG